MRVKEFPYHIGAAPDYILEVRLPVELWRRIQVIAERHRVSYSWVVRFCLFRMIMRSNPAGYLGHDVKISSRKGINSKFYFQNLRAVAQKSAGAFHRHRLCLYGEDELYVRIVSVILGVTMTHLARLAVECNLERLERGCYRRPTRFFLAAFFWLGVKRQADVDLHIGLSQNMTLKFQRYDRSTYWRQRVGLMRSFLPHDS